VTSRRIGFQWHLRRLMAAHDMWKTTDLAPLLQERGVNLSAAQVYRLVAEKPERLSLRTLVALCDIFDCTPADLIEPVVEAASRRKAAGGSTPTGGSGGPAGVTEIHQPLRPTRARIVEDED
jgi:DNA-binding Xre family transcriptional regulator